MIGTLTNHIMGNGFAKPSMAHVSLGRIGHTRSQSESSAISSSKRLQDRRLKIAQSLLDAGADIGAAIDNEPANYAKALGRNMERKKMALKMAFFDPNDGFNNDEYRDGT